jgi:endo-1,4-beta-xylanase
VSALAGGAGQDPTALEIVKRHFNAISPENVLEWVVHPEPERFVFEPVDRDVALGAFVVGHVLVWHHQTPGGGSSRQMIGCAPVGKRINGR